MRGQLLVASPTLVDPNFHRTVILLIEHGEEGSLGVILNRASEMPVGDPLPNWSEHAADPAVIFAGGPVARSSAICLGLAQAAHPGRRWSHVFEGIGTIDLNQAPPLSPVRAGVRVFAGHAGWGPLQLEDELDEGAWVLGAAQTGDVLDAEPDRLWRKVIERQPGVIPFLARFPPDPDLN